MLFVLSCSYLLAQGTVNWLYSSWQVRKQKFRYFHRICEKHVMHHIVMCYHVTLSTPPPPHTAHTLKTPYSPQIISHVSHSKTTLIGCCGKPALYPLLWLLDKGLSDIRVQHLEVQITNVRKFKYLRKKKSMTMPCA